MNRPSTSTRPEVLFISREPVSSSRHGSSTAVNNLLRLLTRHGALVKIVITLAESRSPRLFFRSVFALPAGCTLHVPGYVRFGHWYLRPWAPLAWMRLFARALGRFTLFRPVLQIVQWMSAGRLFMESWDLTEPTPGERAMVRRAVAETSPPTVVANYAFWGPLLATLTGPERVILMHDLLSEHVLQFQQAGLRLDCNVISDELETAWLNGADALIAAQRSEAEAVRKRVRGEVFTQPIELAARPASEAPEPWRCLFVGSNSPPNVQGLLWLLEEVWPLVVREHPEAVLAVAGTVGERVVVETAGVEVLGRLDSLAAEHDRASVCLVPLLVGSGIKIKLLEALSHGKATVSTGVGVQGLEDWASGVVEVEDTAERFAAAVVRLLEKPALRRDREAAATALVAREFQAGSSGETSLVARLVPTSRMQQTPSGDLPCGQVAPSGFPQPQNS